LDRSPDAARAWFPYRRLDNGCDERVTPVMATRTDVQELLGLFMAALRVVLPEVSEEERLLVGQVAEGMVRERADGLDALARTREG